MEIQATLTTVISIFLLMMVGYGAKKVGVLKAEDVGVVNSILIYLTMPAFIFVYVHKQPLTSAMIKVPFLGFVMEMVVIGIAYLAARKLKLDRPTTGALMLVAAFGNTGFLGYPVTNAAFNGDGQALLTAVLFDEFAMAFVLNSIGVAIAACFAGSKFRWNSMLEFLKTPLFPATIIALVLRNVYVPKIIMDTLWFLAKGTVPLAMLSIGLSLSASSIKRYPAAFSVAFILKMALLPLLMYLTLPLIGVTGIVQKVAILSSAMPAAVFTGVVAGKYGANHEFAAGTIFLTTLASVLLIPGILILIN